MIICDQHVTANATGEGKQNWARNFKLCFCATYARRIVDFMLANAVDFVFGMLTFW